MWPYEIVTLGKHKRQESEPKSIVHLLNLYFLLPHTILYI